MRSLIFYFLILFTVVACNSPMISTDDIEKKHDTNETNLVVLENFKVIKRANNTSLPILNDNATSRFAGALEARKRSYEKLMPLFEYEIKFNRNGVEEVWRVNRAGYVMKSGSSELYKMDTTVLHDYMK